MGETWLVDNDSISHYLEIHKNLASQQQYLDNELAERREQIDLIISRYDDTVFVLKNLVALTPLFHHMAAELATLIPEDNKRRLFLAVVKGESLEEIALNRLSTYDKVVCDFIGIIESLTKQQELIKIYPEKPNADTIRMLNTEIYKLVADFRVRNCLQSTEIYTVADLLSYIKHGGGLKALLKIRNFGRMSYYILTDCLREHGIIDKENNCPLLKFV